MQFIMGQIVPDAVERYLAGLNRAGDEVLDAVAADGAAQNLPLVDAEVGALLRVLALSIGAKRILEIGTAIGYSGIWLAGALPKGGMLLTMEKDPERARIARANFDRAGLTDRTGIIVGDAQVTITKVAGPFDLIFQDGHKPLYVALLDRIVAPEARRPAGDGQRVVGRRGRARVRRSPAERRRGHACDRGIQHAVERPL